MTDRYGIYYNITVRCGRGCRGAARSGRGTVDVREYIYETHLHTVQASACSDTPGRDYIQKYIDAGYSGVMITDHFIRGNCAVDRRLPWREFVNRYCAGYEDALNEGIKRNFPVFFGWEETYDGDDYLVYGLDKQWLLEHPEVARWTRARQFEEVHKYGGCVVQAHPFRAASYIHTIHLAPELADAVEGYNAGNHIEWNILGMRYARLSGLPITAGSDNHHADRMCEANLAGVVFDHPLRDVHDYVRAILGREAFRPSVVPPEWTEAVAPELPVEWLDGAERPVAVDTLRALRHGWHRA